MGWCAPQGVAVRICCLQNPKTLAAGRMNTGETRDHARASIAVRGLASTFPTSHDALPASEAAAFEPGDGGYS